MPAMAQFFLQRRRVERHNSVRLRSVVAESDPEAILIWKLEGFPRTLALEIEALPGIGVAYWLAGFSPAAPDEYWQYWSRPGRSRVASVSKTLLRSYALRLLKAEGKPLRPLMQHVAVVSQFELDKGITDGTLPAHARVIYNGVETALFQAAVRARVDEPLRLLLAGRVDAGKGIHTAIESIAILVRERHVQDIHLAVVGSGPTDYHEQLRAMTRAKQLDGHITFTGWLPRPRMPEQMKAAHVLLLPTRHPEPFARVVLEAMASGLAVVASLTGGTGEIVVEGETGLTFPAGDGEALARQIHRLVLDDGLRCRLARSGQQSVLERYTLEQMVDHIELLLLEAVRSTR